MSFSAVPGFAVSSKFLGTKFNKPQRFVFRNGLQVEESSQKKTPKLSKAEEFLGRNAFIGRESPVLKFNAYYCENLDEGVTQFRKCNVLYFTGDDEIKVYEPRQRNSGLEQGCIVGKGRFYKPGGGGGYYTLDDMNVGETLVLFGREYKLMDCDDFTRSFLSEMGYRVRTPEPEIEDPLTQDRDEMNVPKSYRRPYRKEHKYKDYFNHHPKCLRFYGCYGDAKHLFEEKREVTMYYDLYSGTIRLVEERGKWIDGRTDTRLLLRPTRVPKPKELNRPVLIGEMGTPTLLNYAHDVQNVLIGGRYYKIQKPTSTLVDGNPTEDRNKDINYYTDKDLYLGVTLNIFGSDVFLYDCDAFTRKYYRATYNREMVAVPRPEIKPYHMHKLVYQHEIFGEPEQTIRTNDPFLPIRYMTDLKKFFQNDKYGYDVKELKFLAKMVSEDRLEKHKVFVLRFFLEDETMDMKELDTSCERPSVIEHKYLKRMKVVKPRSSVGNSERCYYQPKDMFVGNTIYVRAHAYCLLEADEYSYDYMERNCHIYPHSNVKRLMTCLRTWAKENCGPLKNSFEKADVKGNGCLGYESFRNALYGLMSPEMKEQYPEQTMKTLARHYAEDRYIGLTLRELTTKIKTELYRMKYYDFEDLKLTFAIHDEGKCGLLTPERLYFALRTSSIPVNKDLLKNFIFKFPLTDNKIKYLDLLECMDWVKNPTQYETQEPYVVPINFENVETEKDLDSIRYQCFLTDIVM